MAALLLSVLGSSTAWAQLSGTKSIPGDYATMSAAITDLNAAGVGTGGVTFNVAAGHTETANGLILTATGTAANPIVFQKSGTGANPTITAGAGTSTSLDFILALQGADYVTLDGISVVDPTTNTTSTTRMEFGLALLKVGTPAVNGCQFVTVKNCGVTMQRAYTSSVGIYSANHTTAATTALTPTTAEGTNSNNKFFGNTIGNVNGPIELRGFNASAPYDFYDQNNEIGGATGNTIFDYGAGSTAQGIYAIYQNNVKVFGNTVSSTTGTSTLYGIFLSTGTNSSADVYNNTVTLTFGGTSSSVYGINNAMGGSGTTNTINLYNNTVTLTSTTATSSSWYGVYNTATASTVNMYGNTTPGWSRSGSGTSYCVYQSAGVGTAAMYNNTVRDFTGTSTGSVYGVYNNPSSTTNTEVYGNTVRNMATGAATVYGVQSTTGATTNVYRNKVSDLSAGGTGGQVYGLYIGSGTTVTVHNNLVGNLSAPAATGSNAVVGLFIAGGTTINAYYNTLALSASSTSTTTFGTSGIYVSSISPVVTLRNNLVVNNSTPGATGGATAALRYTGAPGIGLGNATNNNLYYAGTPAANRVIYVEGTGTLANAQQTLANYISYIGNSRETASATENPTFVSTTGTNAGFLHLSPTVPTLAESRALPISGITTDFDGDTRNASTPDIGADEGSFTPGGSATDVAANGLVSPLTVGCYGTAETVTVSIRNNGLQPLNFATTPATVTVTLSGAATQTLTATVSTGTLAPGASQTVSLGTVNMTATGTYTFATSVTVAGDGDASNDNLTATRTVAPTVALPQVVSFTGFTGSNLTAVFPNWYEATGATAPLAGNAAWVSATGVGSTGNVTTKVNLFSTSKNEWIIGPKIAATAATRLSFKAALTDFASTTSPAGAGDGMTGTDDAVRVLVSTDCGVTFTEAFRVDATNQPSPTAIAFSEYSVPLSAYAGQSIIVAFKATDGPVSNTPDYDFHLDDISLIEAAASDAGITALTEPGTAGCYSATQNVTVTIRNYGTTAQSDIPVRVVVGGPVTQTLTGTFTGSIPANGTANFTVGQVNMTALGTYTFDATTLLPGDATAGNDALAQQSRTVTAPVAQGQLVTFTGFTGSNLNTVFPGWTEATGATLPTGTTSGWTNGSLPSGNTTAKINLFSNSKNDWLVSPKFLASATTQLTFDAGISDFASSSADPAGMTGTDDFVEVRISTDCGATFARIPAFAQFNAGNQPSNGSLTSYSINLGSYAGQQIIVAFFASEGTVTNAPDYDFHIDNVRVNSPVAIDLAATALVTPAANQGCYSATETVTVTVRNEGSQALDFAANNATVTAVVTTPGGPQTLTGTLTTGTLAAGATQNVTLTPTLDMSVAGAYSFALTGTVQGDLNTANDALATAVARTVVAPVAGTVSPAAAIICVSGTSTLTLTGAANGSIQWQQSTDNVTFTNVSAATAASFTTPVLTQTAYFRAQVSCGTQTVTSNVATVTVNNPLVTSTNTPVAICEGGTATLTATGSAGTTLRYFEAATGGTALGTGASFTTPALTASRQYFVEAVSGGTETAGKATTTGADGGYSGGNTGLVFNATTAVTIQSVTVFPSSTTAGSMSVELRSSTGTVLATAGPFAVPAGSSTQRNPLVLPINLNVPGAGTYRLVTATSPAPPELYRDFTGGFPFASASGAVTVTGGVLTGNTSTSHYFFYNWQISTECASATRTPIQVNVTPLPTASLPAATASSCGTSPFTLGGTVGGSATGGTYTSSGTGTFSPNATTLNATYTPSAADVAAGTVTLTLTSTNPAACSAAAAQVVLSLTAPAVADFSYPSTTTYCAGSTSTVTPTLGTGATAGTFSSTSGLVIDPATGVINLAGSTAGTYTVTNTLAATGACGAVTATSTVTITPAASAAFSYGAGTYCVSGTNPTATVTGTAGGTFSSTTGLSLNATTGAINLAASTPGTYTVTYTVGTACSATATATVTITTAPVATFSYATANYCAGATGTVAPAFGTGASGGTFSSTAGLSINASTGVINLAASTAGTYTVTNTIAAGGGCAAATATTTVTITAAPAQPVVTVQYTTPGVAVLTSSATTGNQWYLNGQLISGATGQTYTANGTAQPGAYTVVVTGTGGCASPASATLTVTSAVKPLAGSALELFPNPTPDGKLTLQLRGYHQAVELTVLNALGQVVQRHHLPAGQAQQQLDLSTLPSGVYVLRAATKGGLDTRRIVRQ
ncbi:hypothetical protein GCM10027048_36770 [Hymenobacter coalescens]